MKLTRDTWLAFGLLFILIAIMGVVSFNQQQQGQKLPPLVSTSSAPDGALALKLWLKSLKYTVIEETPSSYKLPKAAKIIYILQPSELQTSELKTLNTWVLDGGTLIAAGGLDFSPLTEYFGFDLTYYENSPKAFRIQTPLFQNPVLQASIPTGASDLSLVHYMTATNSSPSYVTHLASDGKPVLVSFERGSGRVILASTAYPFTNLALKQPGVPALMLNLLGLAKKQGPIWFDEWHHGFHGTDTVTGGGPDSWLRYTPLGRSVLFTAVIIFLALLFRGRGFGRPVPLPRELRRRGALEHVSAMANLSRLAGHRIPVLREYHTQLKRTLGRRYRLDPTLPDADYVNRLISYNPALDGAALLKLLNRLQQPKVSENELVAIASEAAKWIKDV